MTTLKSYRLNEIPYIKVNGRTTDCLDPLTVFWTAGGFEVNAKGSELWVELEAGFDQYEPWFSVLVNGAYVSRQMAVRGRSRVCLFRGMNPAEVKHVKFVKDVQAMHEDPGNYLQVYGLEFDGDFLPVPERPYKIEFIGDSITSGEGTYGARQELDWIPMFFSGVNNYAAYTADEVNADFRVISQSGWGVLGSWDGNRECAVPAYYEKVCGLLKGEHNKSLGALEDYDFSKWSPDAVVINLGTNDASALAVEGSSLFVSDFEKASEDFLKKVRRCNPKAEIVWAYGMLGNTMAAPICRAVERYRMETKDSRVHFTELPAATEETIGSREHPGVKNHKAAAKVLGAYLKEQIGKCG